MYPLSSDSQVSCRIRQFHCITLCVLSYVVVNSEHVCTPVLQSNLNLETLLTQYEIVRSETNTSNVSEFGDKVRYDNCK